MDKNLKLFLFMLIVITLVSVVTLLMNFKEWQYQPGVSLEYDRAMNQSQHLYEESKKQKVNLSSGPCLSNAVIPGWVVDIVHNPRQSLDDLPENQCSAFLEGTAKHFVELDLEGDLVRIK